jgi:hypothetical protein
LSEHPTLSTLLTPSSPLGPVVDIVSSVGNLQHHFSFQSLRRSTKPNEEST